MKISFWKWMSIGATLAAKIEEATKDDNRITFEEGMTMMVGVCDKLGVEFDTKGANFVKEIISKVILVSEDGKITINDLLILGKAICDGLGVELDTTGFDIKAR